MPGDTSFWKRMDRILDLALDVPEEQRDAFLQEKCSGDPALLTELRRLLKHNDTNPTFLETPIKEFVSPILNESEHRVIGKTVGAYKIIRQIGQGGMATVYLGEHQNPARTRQFAVKFVRQAGATEQVLKRFQHERRILASLNHPHIARLYDEGMTEDGRPYLVMEYIDGKPINLYCDHKKLDIHERLRVFTQITDAVHHAHLHRIIHRDIKPNNILVTDSGESKLLDFGIAKMLDSNTRLTRTGMKIMTPEYAAPEQILGQKVTPATDVYQLGMLLYELLTAHRPYPTAGGSMQDIEKMIVEMEPVQPSLIVLYPDVVSGTTSHIGRLRRQDPQSLSKTLSGDLDNILMKSIRKEPERRYPTAEALNRDLTRYLAGTPVMAKPDKLGYKTAKWLRKWTR